VKHRTRTLLTALVMLVFASLAIAASSSAATFNGEVEGTAVAGSITEHTSLQLREENLGCEFGEGVSSATLAGTSSSTLSAPAWNPGCHNAFHSINFSRSGCQFRLDAGLHESMQGTMDIVGCTGGSMSAYTEGICHIVIPNQEGLGPIEYVNEGTGSSRSFSLKLAITNLSFTRTGGAACQGPLGTFHNGGYVGVMQFKGSKAGVQKGLWIETEPSVAFGVEEVPASLHGELEAGSRAGMVLPAAGATLSCTEEALTGTMSEKVVENFTVVPAFNGCKLQGVSNPTVSMGGCAFTYHFNRTLDIGGGSCYSNPIRLEAKGVLCVVTIGPQAGLSGLTYKQLGSGSVRYLMITGRATGLTYTSNGVGCESGTFSNGIVGLSGTRANEEVLEATNSLGSEQGLWLY
jgi:hypothetical protein